MDQKANPRFPPWIFFLGSALVGVGGCIFFLAPLVVTMRDRAQQHAASGAQPATVATDSFMAIILANSTVIGAALLLSGMLLLAVPVCISLLRGQPVGGDAGEDRSKNQPGG